jgi:hypothetical protein
VQDVDGAVKEIEVQLPCDRFLEDEPLSVICRVEKDLKNFI